MCESAYFDIYAGKANAQSSSLGWDGSFRTLSPGSDQEQLSAARYKVTDAPLERHKLQKVSASLRHRV